MFVEVAKKGDIVPGGMKGFIVRGAEIVLCNDGGKYYALSKRCGHMNAPLDRGTLVGYILTCPMHYSQFDIRSGRVLSGPMLHAYTRRYKLPEGLSAFFKHMGGFMTGTATSNIKTFFFRRMGGLMAHIKTCNLQTFKVRVDGESIKVEL